MLADEDGEKGQQVQNTDCDVVSDSREKAAAPGSDWANVVKKKPVVVGSTAETSAGSEPNVTSNISVPNSSKFTEGQKSDLLVFSASGLLLFSIYLQLR